VDYAEAINRLNDEVSSVLARAERWGLTDKEMADELRRIADEKNRPDKTMVPSMDFVDVMEMVSHYIQNERVRCFNEGMDEERRRCAAIANQAGASEIADKISNPP
jgi:hypothetical protein